VPLVYATQAQRAYAWVQSFSKAWSSQNSGGVRPSWTEENENEVRVRVRTISAVVA
jgi:hypothetical protein